ncbi:glycosyltransferase [Ruicaihuangia caeni]|uniref:Glycosyltransferase n=1 Tax=Ruicaihuangia caeni TaxID=3042517 RepID=A0AAW6TBP7_9MICO|nr:glycosyltransferase [Klugiella sp. YN-L-19]MDI2099413.1 glycosyltransferase [Klugiella sp. YN-L-19]
MTDPSRPRVLVLTFTPIAREPRALKQIRRFAKDYDVTTAGFGEAPDPDLPHIELESSPKVRGLQSVRGAYLLMLLLRLYRLLYWTNPRNTSAFERLRGIDWDVIVAHDVQTVPLATRLAPNRGVIVDLHEYAPRQNEHSVAWRLLIGPYFRWILRKHVSHAASVTTVSQGIVEEYRREFGLETELVANATPFHDFSVGEVGSPIRLVHSGIPAPARKLEVMIDAVKETSTDVILDLYLIKDGSEYYEQLKQRAAGSHRIRFVEPVPYSELLPTLNTYDVGLSVIAPTTFNLAWCLPNKFFDFIQARLGVIIGPSPEMMRFVDEHDIGAVTRDFSADALREVLDSLTPEKVSTWKNASHHHARELSSEKQVEIWAAELARVLG